MAVEYEEGFYLFLPAPVLKEDFCSGDLCLPYQKVSCFKNTLHDLESVLWINLWFLLSHLPGWLTPEERERHFDCILTHSLDRYFFIRNCGSVYYEVLSAVMEVYGRDYFELSQSVRCFENLAYCYHVVEQSEVFRSEPEVHWDPKELIQENYYEVIQSFFMCAHKRMQGTNHKVLPLRDIALEGRRNRV
ncbi:hypothetical protein CPB85DRAFT_1308535 [Mucidula mucida]|nr:hypothetical protein CPB85DRAFT_1308535 [Mucidula mucida]